MDFTISTNKLAQIQAELNSEKGYHEPWEELDEFIRQAYRNWANQVLDKMEEMHLLENILKGEV